MTSGDGGGTATSSKYLTARSIEDRVGCAVSALPDSDDIVGVVSCEDLVDEESFGLCLRDGIKYFVHVVIVIAGDLIQILVNRSYN